MMNKIEHIKNMIKSLQVIYSYLECEIMYLNDSDTATGQQMAKDGEVMVCYICGKGSHIKNDDGFYYNPILEKYFHAECVKEIDKEPIPMSSVMISKSDFINKVCGENIICNTCGNIKKPTTKIKEGYYCQGCQNDLMPDDVKEGEVVKRKFCFSCGSRLDGFYKVDDMEELICEKCDAMDGRR